MKRWLTGGLLAAILLLMLVSCGREPALPGGESDPSGSGSCAHRFTQTASRQPDCTQAGEAEYVCTLCGKRYTVTLEPVGHRFSPWTAELPAEAAADDRESRVCAVCGLAESRAPELPGGGDESVAAALAELPGGSGAYYDAASAAPLEALIRLYEMRRGTLNQGQADRMAEALQAARCALAYITSDVPLVYITVPDAVGEEYGPAELVFVETDGTVDCSDAQAQIRIHGNSTSWTTKKSYNIKLSAKAELFGVETAKKWVLIGNQYDCTRLRNALVYTLAAEMGLPYTPECTFADVYVNGTYWGSYLLVEKVDVNKNSVNIDLSAGDFLAELECYRNEDGVTYVETARWGVRLGINEPEVPADAQLTAIRAVLDGFENALAAGDWAGVAAVIDVPSFVDYFILHELTKDVDCGVSSTRFYCQGSILYGGPAWDFDLSLGNVSPSEYDYYYTASPDGTEALYSVSQLAWFRELWKYPEFQALVTVRYGALLPTFSALYEEDTPGGSLIDRLVLAYGASFTRTSKLIGCRFYAYSALEREPDKTYAENLSFLRSWLRARDAWLRQRFGLS